MSPLCITNITYSALTPFFFFFFFCLNLAIDCTQFQNASKPFPSDLVIFLVTRIYVSTMHHRNYPSTPSPFFHPHLKPTLTTTTTQHKRMSTNISPCAESVCMCTVQFLDTILARNFLCKLNTLFSWELQMMSVNNLH